MSGRDEESTSTRVWGSWTDTTPHGQPLSGEVLALLERLPLDSDQRESAAQALANQSSRVTARFESEASAALSRLDALNEHLAGLRRSMEVTRSVNQPADQAVRQIDASFS